MNDITHINILSKEINEKISHSNKNCLSLEFTMILLSFSPSTLSGLNCDIFYPDFYLPNSILLSLFFTV